MASMDIVLTNATPNHCIVCGSERLRNSIQQFKETKYDYYIAKCAHFCPDCNTIYQYVDSREALKEFSKSQGSDIK